MTEQEKREKVIKAIECRLDINGSKYKHCRTCDYRHDIDHCQWACQTDGILEDALALLKPQEPVNVNVTIEQSDGWKEGNCPKCGMKLDSFYNTHFCGTCGQVVKWE